MPRSLASAPIRARSATCVRGLAIVSTKTSLVAGVSARWTLATSVASTNVTFAPCAASVLNWLTVLPNRNWLDTTWSPSRSSESIIAPIAAMPGREADGGHAVLHLRDLGLQRGGRRVALPAVGIALRPALEHRGEVARVAIAVGDRHVQRLVQRAVLDAGIAVGMEDGGRESPRRLVRAHRRLESKKPVRRPPNGFGACIREIPRATA